MNVRVRPPKFVSLLLYKNEFLCSTSITKKPHLSQRTCHRLKSPPKEELPRKCDHDPSHHRMGSSVGASETLRDVTD